VTDSVELIQGTLDLMILKALAAEPRHGFGVARWIERVTERRLSIEEGALYPALHRLERRGWLSSEWRVTENNRRAKYYRLTEAAEREFERLVRTWEGSAWAVNRVLEAGA
jgi:PadR family transcriptional regulator PadR